MYVCNCNVRLTSIAEKLYTYICNCNRTIIILGGRERRESWLLCFCLPGVSWWLSGSSLRCHGLSANVIVVFPDHTHLLFLLLFKSSILPLSHCAHTSEACTNYLFRSTRALYHWAIAPPPLRLALMTYWVHVKHSTTEPLRPNRQNKNPAWFV